jgi:ureidoglycolate lyase
VTSSGHHRLAAQPIDAEPISEAAFRPYGRIVQPGSRPVVANAGTSLRHDIGDVMVRVGSHGRLLLSVFEAQAQSLPVRITMLERHPRSAQTIVPMNAVGHLIVVALGDGGGADESTLRAFLVGPDQGINYDPGIWHHPIIALGRPCAFFVQSWQDGSDRDCQETTIRPRIVTAGRFRADRRGMP